MDLDKKLEAGEPATFPPQLKQAVVNLAGGGRLPLESNGGAVRGGVVRALKEVALKTPNGSEALVVDEVLGYDFVPFGDARKTAEVASAKLFHRVDGDVYFLDG